MRVVASAIASELGERRPSAPDVIGRVDDVEAGRLGALARRCATSASLSGAEITCSRSGTRDPVVAVESGSWPVHADATVSSCAP